MFMLMFGGGYVITGIRVVVWFCVVAVGGVVYVVVDVGVVVAVAVVVVVSAMLLFVMWLM